jgi:ABC-type branched-subunit amino acid transport system ATPase component
MIGGGSGGSSPRSGSSLLRTEAVSKAFGGVQALSGTTIDVERGAIAGLIGPNGSGKTTLFNIITGYARADSGDVFLDGKSITNARPERVFGLGIGRTFQLTRIFPSMTVLENMLIAGQHKERSRNPLAKAGGAASRRHAMELLDFVGIASHAPVLAQTLSYGQRKLLELAYVLVADPEILLLDEPAGGVNPSLVNTITGKIRELNAAGKTFLIVEHNMDFVMGLCAQIMVLDYGTVIASGPPEEVRNDPKVLDAYLGTDEDDGDDQRNTEAGLAGP